MEDINFHLRKQHDGTYHEGGRSLLHFKNAEQMKKCLKQGSALYERV
jgi:hypothetical protein